MPSVIRLSGVRKSTTSWRVLQDAEIAITTIRVVDRVAPLMLSCADVYSATGRFSRLDAGLASIWSLRRFTSAEMMLPGLDGRKRLLDEREAWIGARSRDTGDGDTEPVADDGRRVTIGDPSHLKPDT